MLHSVLCDGEYYADVAQRYQVTQSMISRLAKAVRQEPCFFDKLIQKEKEKAAEKSLIAEKISEYQEEKQVISSVNSVAKHLKKHHEIDKKPWVLAQIMKEELGMRYRKIKMVTVNTNSERNLVLRQQFALELIRLLVQGKRVVNID